MLTTLIIIPILGSLSLLCLNSGNPTGGLVSVGTTTGYDLKVRQLALS